MDTKRAGELVAQERERIEGELAKLREEGPEEGTARREPGDQDSENLYQDEFDTGREQTLKDQLAAVERAEQRIAAGTYGLSVRSGEPIPDGRLEANPIAELTVEEQDPSTRGG